MMRLAAWFLAAMVLAADLAQAQPAKDKEPALPLARSLLRQQQQVVEKQIASRMLRRQSVGGDAAVRLDFQIDQRIVLNWLLEHALESKSDDDLASGFLRAGQIAEAMQMVEQLGDGEGPPLDEERRAAMADVNRLTYQLSATPTGRDMDAAARRLGAALVRIGVPGGLQRELPAARPREAAVGATTAAAAGAMREDLARQARGLNVAPALKRQVLGLLASAESLQREGKTSQADPLWAMVQASVEVARGVQLGAAASPEARAAIEERLTEGLLLLQDPRTAAAGRRKIDSLSAYRDLAARVQRIDLPRPQTVQLAPVFAWAQKTPDAAGKALALIDRHIALYQRMSGRGAEPNAMANLRKAVEDLERQYELASSAFLAALADAVRMDESGGGPANFAAAEQRLDEQRRAMELIERLDAMPRAVETINALRPRPFGAIERRLALSAAAAASPAASAQRETAERFVRDLHALAEAVRGLESIGLGDVSAEISRAWTGGRLADLSARWRTEAGEVATQAAAGAEIPAVRLGRLESIRRALLAVREAVEIERSIRVAGGIEGWMDWRVGVEDLSGLLDGYRQSLAEAFSRLLGDEAGPLEAWESARRQYRPLLATIERAAAQRQQFAGRRWDLHSLGAALMTPLDGSAYRAERLITLAAAARRRALAVLDEATAADITRTLLLKLK